MKGKFITIEGIDGCGGQTQTELLKKHFPGECMVLSFPSYETDLGRIIDKFLHKKIHYNVSDVELLVFYADILQWKDKINKAINSGINVIADRYVTSTLVYQSIQSEKNILTILSMIELFKLPLPDVVIYLDITPEESQRRKAQEKQGLKNLDRNEVDLKFLRMVRDRYLEIVQANLLRPWKQVNGMQSIQKVHKDILKEFGL